MFTFMAQGQWTLLWAIIAEIQNCREALMKVAHIELSILLNSLYAGTMSHT
jgi:hypothetical protein